MATTNYSWNLPTVGGSEDAWGTQLNANWTALDTLLGGTNATEFAILDGATVTTAELNLLDGVTWTLTDYNALTATATELNVLDGVTGKTGADTTLVTGTAGTDGQYAQWNADGDVVGVTLPTLAEATWEAGTDTTEATVSPAKVKAAIEAQNPSTLTETGSTTLPGGVILKWGKTATLATSSLTTITFDTAFPTACFNVQAVLNTTSFISGDKSDYANVGSVTASSFQVRLGADTSAPVFWFAIGH